MTQQQQLEKRRQPLSLPQPSELAAAIGRDWREPKKLQLAFDSWVKQQHPVIEVLTATIAGSGQVRLGIGAEFEARTREREAKKEDRENRNQCRPDGCLLSTTTAEAAVCPTAGGPSRFLCSCFSMQRRWKESILSSPGTPEGRTS